ncbi:MAG: hypothetical protein R3A13_08960 [Bdellovibrionota bacterium]
MKRKIKLTLKGELHSLIFKHPKEYIPILCGFDSPGKIIEAASLDEDFLKTFDVRYRIKPTLSREYRPGLFIEDDNGILHEKTGGSRLFPEFSLDIAEACALKAFKDLGLEDREVPRFDIFPDSDESPASRSEILSFLKTQFKKLHEDFVELAALINREKIAPLCSKYDQNIPKPLEAYKAQKEGKDTAELSKLFTEALGQMTQAMNPFFNTRDLVVEEIIFGDLSEESLISPPSEVEREEVVTIRDFLFSSNEEDFFKLVESELDNIVKNLGLKGKDALETFQNFENAMYQEVSLRQKLTSFCSISTGPYLSLFTLNGTFFILRMIGKPSEDPNSNFQKMSRWIFHRLFERIKTHITDQAAELLPQRGKVFYQLIAPLIEDQPISKPTLFKLARDCHFYSTILENYPEVENETLLELEKRICKRTSRKERATLIEVAVNAAILHLGGVKVEDIKKIPEQLESYVLKSAQTEKSFKAYEAVNRAKEVLGDLFAEKIKPIILGETTLIDPFMYIPKKGDNEFKFMFSHIPDCEKALGFVDHLGSISWAEFNSILSTVSTVDGLVELSEFLAVYSRRTDPFAEHGRIHTLVELEKRVEAINLEEGKLDALAKLVGGEETFDEIMRTPNLLVSELEYLTQHEDFKKLVEGELDKGQPLESSTCTFFGFNVTKALRAQMDEPSSQFPGKRKLYTALNRLLRKELENGKFDEAPTNVKELLSNVPFHLEPEIVKLLEKLGNLKLGPYYQVDIHNKSDWRGWIAAYLTDNCFKLDKNEDDHPNAPVNRDNVRETLLAPQTQIATVSLLKTKDAKPRPIIHSLLIQRKAPSHIWDRKFVSPTGEIKGELPRSKDQYSDVLIVDNIEAANNYTSHYSGAGWALVKSLEKKSPLPVKIGDRFSDIQFPGAALESSYWGIDEPRLPPFDSKGPYIYQLPKSAEPGSLEYRHIFRNLYLTELGEVSQLSKDCHQGVALPEERLKWILSTQLPTKYDDSLASFAIYQDGEPVGYVLACFADSIFYPGEKVLSIVDFGFLPNVMTPELVKLTFERMIKGAQVRNIGIEIQQRFGEFENKLAQTVPNLDEFLRERGFIIDLTMYYIQDYEGVPLRVFRVENKHLGHTGPISALIDSV